MADSRAPIDHHSNKPSRVIIIGANGDFAQTKKADVSAKDDHSGEWDCIGVQALGANSDRLIVRLRCTKAPKSKDGRDPTTGTLTVTIANGPVVTSLPVSYVDDTVP